MSDLDGAFWQRYPQDEVVVFGLSSGGETPEELEFFIEEFLLSYPVLADANSTYNHYRQSGATSPYPLDYIIDPEGKVAYFSTEYEPDAMTAIIDELIGWTPDIRVEPTAVDFGGVVLGESAFTLVSVFNDGLGSLIVDGIATSDSEFEVNLEDMILAPGASQTLLVDFTPSELGPIDGELLLSSNDVDEPSFVVALHGEGVSAVGADWPLRPFDLHQNEPNPFSGETSIRFSLESPQEVSLELFDLRGRLVRSFGNGNPRERGEHQIVWDGRDEQGRPLPSGVYFYKLKAGGKEGSRKAILIR